MSKVMIDMEMPKNCLSCKFMEIFYDKVVFIKQNIKGVECQNITNGTGYSICRLENAEIKKDWERPSWCPLQEVREEENMIENETGEMSMVKLKSCPFCGGIATLYTEELPNGYSGDIDYRIECTNCEANVRGYDTEQQAIDAWNRRS